MCVILFLSTKYNYRNKPLITKIKICFMFGVMH